MRLIAIAGPYRAKTEWETVEHIRRAEALALELWRMGVAVICPHKNTAFFGGAAPDDAWLEGAREMVLRSDALCCVDGWERSEGAREEVRVARDHGIPVFMNASEVSDWLSQG